jgi:branched-chain amino acid transport system permease protein
MKRGAFAWVAILLVCVAIPFLLGHNNYVMSLIIAALVIGGIALAWALLGNLGGMVSFGHSAFFGVGAYVSALSTMQADVPVMAGLLLGGVGAVVASLVMLPVLRLRGPYFALAILAYAHIFKIVATEWSSVTGGSGGLSNIPSLPTVLGFDLSGKAGSYLIILAVLVVFIICYQAISKSYYGIALRAMHDSEDATRVVGVNSTLLKAMMLFVSAFMTGVVGAFNVHYIGFLEPDYAFNGVWVTLPIIAAIFGGYRTIWGPVLGALVVYLVDQLIFKNLIPSGHQLILGGLLVAMIIFSPRGLAPVLFKGGRKHAAA